MAFPLSEEEKRKKTCGTLADWLPHNREVESNEGLFRIISWTNLFVCSFFNWVRSAIEWIITNLTKNEWITTNQCITKKNQWAKRPVNEMTRARLTATDKTGNWTVLTVFSVFISHVIKTKIVTIQWIKSRILDMIDDWYINNVAKNQISAVFRSRVIFRSVSPKFRELCMKTPRLCPTQKHLSLSFATETLNYCSRDQTHWNKCFF